MSTLGIVLFAFGALLILSVALNSWENAWNVLTGQSNAVSQLFKGNPNNGGSPSATPKI